MPVIWQVITLSLLHVAAPLRLPVPPTPPHSILRGFLTVEKRPAFIAHRRPGNTLKNKIAKTVPFCAKPEKPCSLKGVAGFEPSANRIGAFIPSPLPDDNPIAMAN